MIGHVGLFCGRLILYILRNFTIFGKCESHMGRELSGIY